MSSPTHVNHEVTDAVAQTNVKQPGGLVNPALEPAGNVFSPERRGQTGASPDDAAFAEAVARLLAEKGHLDLNELQKLLEPK
jgi:hypothetical protein